MPDEHATARRYALLTLALCLLVLLVARWHALTSPAVLGYDEGLFLVQGMAWTQGHEPSRDTWVNKPPLFASIFALCDAALPGDPRLPRLVQTLCLLGTALVLGRMVGRWWGGPGGVVAAVAFCGYAATRMNPGDAQPLFSEAFFVLPLVLGWALLLGLGAGVSRWRLLLRTFVAALMLGLAFQIRQNAILALPVFAGMAALHPSLGSGWRLRRRAGIALLGVAGFVVSLLPSALHAMLAGTGRETLFWTWVYPRLGHVFSPLELLGPGAAFLGDLLQEHRILSLFLGLGALACIIAFARPRVVGPRVVGVRWRGAFVLLVLAASAGMTVLGGRGYEHYWVMFAPVAGALVGVGFGALLRVIPARFASVHARRVVVGVLVALLAWGVGRGTYRTARAAARYDGYFEVVRETEHSDLLETIDARTRPGDTIYVLGTAAGIYYRARRAPAAPDMSGTLLFSPQIEASIRHHAVPDEGGRLVPIPDLIGRRMADAALIVDLTAVPDPRPDRIAGQRVRWDHMGAATVDELPAIWRTLQERFRPLDERPEGVILYVPRR